MAMEADEMEKREETQSNCHWPESLLMKFWIEEHDYVEILNQIYEIQTLISPGQLGQRNQHLSNQSVPVAVTPWLNHHRHHHSNLLANHLEWHLDHRSKQHCLDYYSEKEAMPRFT